MSDKSLNKTAIAEAVEKAPAVADMLRKLADKVARGVALPGSFTAKGLDYDAQRELDILELHPVERLSQLGQRRAAINVQVLVFL